MSVLIKGMTMPKNCEQCPCSDSYGCAVLSQTMATKEMKSGRPNWCPLVEIKMPHGRLIDADELWNKMSNYIDNEGVKFPFGDDDSIIHRDSACFMIECADTIIEAEGAEV